MKENTNVKPKVSVIVPVYNTEKYLKECLDSIVNQSLKNIEIICVNDGSPDNSLKILRDFEYNHSNFKIINQFNKGVASARNIGIKNCNGQFIAFMDSDDYYPDRDCLELLYTSAIENNVYISGGSWSEDHDNGRWIRKDFEGVYKDTYTFRSNHLMSFRDYQFDYGYQRFIYHRELLLSNEIYFPPYIRFQDPPFFVKAMITAGKFYALSKNTYCYRYGHQNLQWNETRTSHVCSGLVDILKMSQAENLKELNKLETWRLLTEYKKPIMQNIKSSIISSILDVAKEYIDMNYVNSSEELSNNMKEIYHI